MTVEKYKPKATPHSMDRRLENSLSRLEASREISVQTITRNKQLIEESREVLKGSREAMRFGRKRRAAAA